MANDRIALVTGATRSAGIGAAICRRLAHDGCAVAFTHWTPYDTSIYQTLESSEPEKLAIELEQLGVRAMAVQFDQSRSIDPDTLYEEIASQLGPVAILVNNAAHSTNTPIDTLTGAEMDAHYAVNVRGMALLTQGFLRQWQGSQGGRIINMTSGQSLGPMPDELAYAATKGAVEAFTVSLASAVASRGVTVDAVNPGPTDTGWISDELKAGLLPRFPMGRIGAADDAAKLVVFLASEEAEWITGQVIHSEGGFRRG